MEFDRNKFKELVLFICARCSDEPEKLGKTKLNKILWFSEALRFINHGEAITGETYIKEKYGPVSRSILSVLNELQREGRLEVRKTNFHGMTKFEYVAHGNPDLGAFSPEEIALVGDVAQKVCDEHTAQSISELSHTEIWDMAKIGDPIPLGTVLMYRLAEVSDDTWEWAKKEAETIAA